MRSRLAVLALTVPLALASLTACSGSVDASDGTGAAGASTSPSAATDDAAPVALPEGEEVSGEELTDLVTTAFERATTARLDMRLTAGGQDVEATGEADYTTDPVSVRLDLSGAGPAGDVTVVLVDGVLYLRLPARGEEFVRLDLDDPANPLGDSFTSQLDPRAQAEVIERGLVRATYVGQEQVQGETLDHYAALVDAQAMLDGADLGPAAAGVLPDQVTYDLWFDAEGLYRQMSVDLGATAGEVLIRFEDWGTDVDIEAPPADQVSDASSLTG
jgi:hypothetical protein